ncbi:hypothetical protein SEUCBS139899_007653 [Sporothrix eucalyptigena]
MPSKYNKLQDARVLIIGGTSGIGFATAEAVVESGAFVVFASSKASSVANAISRIKASYPEATTKIRGYQVDLSEAETLESNLTALFETATGSNTVKLDHVVYTAAGVPDVPSLVDFTATKTKPAFLLHRYDAPILVGKLAPTYLSPGPRSSITLTASSTASKPTPGRPLLTALGSATEGITRGLAVELAPIRVNAVSPGVTDTELLVAIVGSDPTVLADFKQTLKKETLLSSVGAPDDVAEAYLYLMKDGNITGEIIYSDGGRKLKPAI